MQLFYYNSHNLNFSDIFSKWDKKSTQPIKIFLKLCVVLWRKNKGFRNWTKSSLIYSWMKKRNIFFWFMIFTGTYKSKLRSYPGNELSWMVGHYRKQIPCYFSYLSQYMYCQWACNFIISRTKQILVLTQILPNEKNLQNFSNDPGGAQSAADGDFAACCKLSFCAGYYYDR